jgi:Tfp pilus assembly protein FimT
LIELILVMSILIIVITVTGPSLTSFFRGQTLDAESRRFLALTRYAQSRAVAEGVPMTLWIDAKQRSYGLEIEAGFADRDDQAKEYAMEKDLEIEVTAPLAVTGMLGTPAVPGNANELKIRFTPDGFISEANPEAIIIREGDKAEVWITPNRNRLNYEINTNNLPTARR